jgi:FkbM family methyltransferase
MNVDIPVSDEDLSRHDLAIARARPRVVLDVGANFGHFAQRFLDHGAEQVVCIEPIPDIFAKLSARFAGQPRVMTMHLAVSDYEHVAEARGMLTNQSVFNCYTLRPRGLDSGLLAAGKPSLEDSPDYRYKPAFDVELWTVDRVVAELGRAQARTFRPDFIKIDVDGYEPRVMRGAALTIREVRPPIMLELSYLPRFFGECCECMIADALALGYQIEVIRDGTIYQDVASFMRVFPWNTSFDVMLWPRSS